MKLTDGGYEVFRKVNILYNDKTSELYIDDHKTGEMLAGFKAEEL